MTRPGALLACATVVALAVLVGASSPAFAAIGDLDPSFGVGGRVTTDLDPIADDVARAVAVQPDGKIIVGVRDSGDANRANSRLVRYQRDGRLDASFGIDGVVSTTLRTPDGFLHRLVPEDVAVQPDGKILVAGNDSTVRRFAIARYDADGSVDSSFGTSGRIVPDFPSAQPTATATRTSASSLVLAPGGKIVAAGEMCESLADATLFHTILVGRYGPDGTPDPTFGSNGAATIAAGSACSLDEGGGVALQGDGRVVVASGINDGTISAPAPSDFLTLRLTADGHRDPAFGAAGVVRTDIRGDDEARDVAIQPNGRIVVAGSARDATGGGFALARYNTDGSLDTSFDGDGKLVSGSGELRLAVARGLALQDDGRLVVGGCTSGCGVIPGCPTGCTESQLAVARYTPDGALDPSFAGDGAVTGFGPRPSLANDVAIQPDDGRIVAAGGARDSGGDVDVAVARYTARTVDLSVSASASADPVMAGGELSYTLSVVNRGPDAAGPVTLDDALSPLVDYVSSSASQGTCGPAADGRSVSCVLGGLARGGSATLRIVVSAARSGTATNTASVQRQAEDSDNANDAASVSSVIVAAPEPAPESVPSSPASGGSLFAAKLGVVGARVLRSARVLRVLAPISARASGRVRVRFQAGGHSDSFDARVDARHRRVRFDRRVSAAQARLGTGIITLTYGGDGDTQRQEVRLRAASRPAGLVAGRPRIAGGRLTASGLVGASARGVVRIQVVYEPPAGATRTVELTAPIRRGRYRIDERLPAGVVAEIAQRRGVVQSYTLFTGYEPRRIRGEMTALQILPNR